MKALRLVEVDRELVEEVIRTMSFLAGVVRSEIPNTSDSAMRLVGRLDYYVAPFRPGVEVANE